MPLLSTEAIVLSTLRLGEADKLITFFTLSRGKIAGVARGARRFKNRFGAALEPFTESHLVLFEKGGSHLFRISQADIIHSFQKLRDEWETIELGTQMVRFVLRMTPEAQPHPAVYHLLKEALGFLETGIDRPLTFVLFLAHLIQESGYQPRWDQCVRCNKVCKTQGSSSPAISFSQKEGGIFCSSCAHAFPASLSLSLLAISFLQTVSKIDFRSAHHQTVSLLVKREVFTVLKEYITFLYPAALRPRTPTHENLIKHG